MNALSSIEPAFGARLPARRRPAATPAIRYAGLDDASGTVELDLRAIWTALYRNRLVIGIVVAVALLAGVASILLTAPTFRAQASVQVDAQSAKVLDTDDLEPLVAGSETERFIRTQMDIVRSRSLAASVADTLDLASDASFVAGDIPAPKRRQAVLDTLQERLSVEMLPNSRIVRIGFDDPDAVRASRVANAFADTLIKSNLQRRFATSAYSRQFLGGQLAEAKRKLEDSERAMIAYARDAHLIDASAGATRTDDVGTKSLTTANLVELNDAYAAARAGRIQAQQRAQLANSARLMTLPEVLADPTIQQLSQRLSDLNVAYQEERQRRKEDHPSVRQLSARIAATSREIAVLAGNIRSSIDARYAVAQSQETALAGDVDRLKQATLAEQDRGVRYNILKREVDTGRGMYDALLQRYKEISAAAGISSNNIAIVDRSDVSERPISPNAIVNMGIALLAGLSLALAAVFARERFIDRIRDPEDIERKLRLPILGVVARLADQRSPQGALADQRSSFSESHNSICTALDFASSRGTPRSIMLTSSWPSEGKSTTAMALAISYAREGKLVALIDADLRRPSLHEILNLPNRVGLVHLLTKNKALEDVIQQTEVQGLYFIGSGPLPPSPSGLLSGDALPAMLAELVEAFDVVIVDAPPVLGLADAPRLSSIVDATVFVLEANGAQARSVVQALRRLGDSRARIAGSVLTKYSGGLRHEAEYSYGYGSFADLAPVPLPAAA